MLSERITEGYMYSFFPEEEISLNDKISHLIKVLKEKHPNFKFNTCWINGYEFENACDEELNPDGRDDGITVEPEFNILRSHYWFVWIEENENAKV